MFSTLCLVAKNRQVAMSRIYMISFMRHSVLVSILPENLNYIATTLYYQRGMFPTVFHLQANAKVIGLALFDTILYNGISYFAFVKIDVS